MNGSRRIAPLILIVIITVLVIAVLVAVGRALLVGPSSGDEAVDTSRESLLDTSQGQKVQMTVRGPIVGDENFRSYQITITPSQRQFVAYSGYLDQVIMDKRMSNNVPAYEELVYALDRIGMMAGDEVEGPENDVRGICPDGQLYQFAVMENDNTVKKLWTTSCSNVEGTLKGSPDQIGDLFVDQFDDGYDLIREARSSTND